MDPKTHSATSGQKSLPYHNSSITLTTQLLAAGPKVSGLNYRLAGLAQLAAMTTVPAEHRDNVKKFWSDVKTKVQSNTTGCSLAKFEIDKAIQAIEAQKLEGANGADKQPVQSFSQQQTPVGQHRVNAQA